MGALSMGLETPTIDAIIYWNQGMLGKEYLVDNALTGKDIGECILPTQWGYPLEKMADVVKDRSKNGAAADVDGRCGASIFGCYRIQTKKNKDKEQACVCDARRSAEHV